jgi:hypothetical protein
MAPPGVRPTLDSQAAYYTSGTMVSGGGAIAAGGYIGINFEDLVGFFMSLLHEVQETFERAWGVDEGITELLLAMATQLQGRFMTAAGALPPVPIARGLWQGCPNGPRRSMMVMTAVCEYVEACVPGFAVPTPRQGTLSVAEVAAADDVGQMADSEALQQLMLEGFWVGTVVGEIGMGHDEHDASKSAAMTGGFNEGTWLEETLRLFTLPLGAAAADVMMARVRKHYPHLGTELLEPLREIDVDGTYDAPPTIETVQVVGLLEHGLC